jgi:hypothetical protein
MHDPILFIYINSTFMLASRLVCTCSGNGLPDWTLELLHARCMSENGMLAAILFKNTMPAPSSLA